MKSYVLGFLFDMVGERVALLEKAKPDWQKGRLNGIGGKVEVEEMPLEAMIREFKEETGLLIEDWKEVAFMSPDDCKDLPFISRWYVDIFAAKSDRLTEVKTTTVEPVNVFSVREVACLDSTKVISNVPWLVLACRDMLFNPNGPKYMDIIY